VKFKFKLFLALLIVTKVFFVTFFVANDAVRQGYHIVMLT